MDRRGFLRYTALSAGAMAVGGWALGAACEGFPTLPEPAVRAPLRFGRPMAGRGELVASSGAGIALGDGRVAPAWGYNDEVPGPTIRVRRGELVDIRFRNELEQETTVHWHGMVVPSEMDGHPARPVAPGHEFAYRYEVVQRAGTYWYHAHPHHHAGEQVFRGLAGVLIVEDEEEDALGLPTGDYELPLVLRDARVDRSGALRYASDPTSPRGDFPVINGVPYPEHDVARARYRLRVLNGSNARVFRLALSNGAPMTVIGNDGGLLEVPESVSRVELGPAERVDLLVDFRQYAPGERIALQCLRSGWDLLEFVVVDGEPVDQPPIPTRLSMIEPLSPTQVRAERTFVFEGHSRINGKRFDPERIDFRVPLGQVERWTFRAEGSAPHPIHVHGTHFQVVSRSGGRGRVFPWERGWKDTVLLLDGEVVDVLVRFGDYRGLYLIHCHRLEHEDGGMMLNFEVV